MTIGTEKSIQPEQMASLQHKRILLAYSSRTGTTTDVVFAIARALDDLGNNIEVKTIDEVSQVNDYDAIIVGSPINYDHWLPEAIDFMNIHHATLSQRPVAAFFTCLTLSRKTEKAKKQAEQYAEELYRLHPDINLLSVGSFAGVLDYKRLKPIFRPLARVLFFILGVKEGDYRDWTAIDRWARETHTKLNHGQVASIHPARPDQTECLIDLNEPGQTEHGS